MPRQRAQRRFRGSIPAVLFILSAAPAAPANERPLPARDTPSDTLHEAVDYNAPSRDTTLSRHLFAIANLGVQSWALWQLSWLRGEEWPLVTRDSLETNLHEGFEFDRDEMQTNFLGHPYHGGLMFTSARGVGLGFWTSAVYLGAGTLGWELFAENELPSGNDMIMTTLPGLMLGEITYRLASELLDESDQGSSRVGRELAAAAVSPMRGFQRLSTGRAWSEGAPPKRHAVRAGLHVGGEVVRVRAGSSNERNGPSLLLATQVDYGTLAGRDDGVIEPLSMFELYAGVSLFDSQLTGARVDATGVLWGHSRRLSSGGVRDAAAFGIGMSYEFQGSNVLTYGGAGIGPASYLSVGLGARRQLRIGIGLELVPMLSLAERDPAPGERGYAFGAGASLWSGLWLDLAEAGSLRWRSRQYATAVLDGGSGGDYVISTRLSYQIDALDVLGFGAAPTLTYHRALREPPDSTLELSGQFYVRLQN